MSASRVWRVVLDLLGRGTVVERVRAEADQVVAEVRPDRRARPRCGRCGAVAPVFDAGRGRRRWRHLDAAGHRLWIEADAPRVRCRQCGPTVAAVSWARHNAGHTRAFDATVCWKAVRMSKTAVTALMRIGWDTIGAIIARFVAEADTQRPDPLDGLRRIGIDEISYRKHFKYLLVVVDHDTRRVVWIGVGRTKQTMASFFDTLGADRTAGITHITSDCADFIATVVGQRCPTAIHAADPFHVVAWATDALDEVRRRHWNQHRQRVKSGTHPKGEGTRIKAARWALWKNPDHLNANQRDVLTWLEIAHPELHRAYLYKERLRLLLKLPLDSARPSLKAWIKAAKLSRIPEIRQLAFKIQRHQDKILTAIEHHLSNGLLEAINAHIRLLIRQAYGFKRLDHLTALIHLTLGGYNVSLPWNENYPS